MIRLRLREIIVGLGATIALLVTASHNPAPPPQAPVGCKTGHRGPVALAVLQMLGCTKAGSLYGGLEGWKATGLGTVK